MAYFMLYVCLLLLPFSGFLQLAFGPPVTFLGLQLHFWTNQDDSLFAWFSSLHTGLAFALLG